MDIIDTNQIECNRSLDEIRKRYGKAKRTTRKYGLIRSLFYWFLDWWMIFMIYLGLKKKPVKKRAKRKKKPISSDLKSITTKSQTDIATISPYFDLSKK
ncbi:unnamed protein product [Caenorhabditis angaria]|uniref:Uncharacterized protein n=1 Tax=Caenorhabditis angaria TaxID=860376 RepID=A0A9P1I5I2_9PELO|nr:unnamed protein product [Caenorhabditis angaria]